jgi:predicted RND superfamily exporter protein
LSLVPETARQSLVDGAIAAQRPLFSKLGLTHDDQNGENWRLTVRTSALGSADYGALLAGVRAKVESALATENASLGERVSVNVTGVMPLVHRIQGQLLDDLLASFAGALVLITVTMTLAQAGVRAGLLAMASNVFPIALYFGWLGWRGQPIDIGVVMTASVALGIAVDDTLHYLSFFRRAVEEGSSRFDAVRESLARCAPAMIQTSVSCGLGLLVFALSDFAPTRGFAISMAVLLGLALAGDLLLLPALLVGPFGAVCAPDTAAATDEGELRANAA